eukprot:TRINITY_DN5001_c0_g2_i5.p1 TRINITY_DN5001_c0_g2~~TRINITY_DN5001_c0_g2_i5.p1  ORF type:complete len:776 (+),score=105.19 TRINITY_DN5001_c0_g2_i5:132-2330(+)
MTRHGVVNQTANQLQRSLQRSRNQAVLNGKRHYTFASPAYVSCFGEKPPVDVSALRSSTIRYIESFDSKAWYEDPVSTLVQGEKIPGGEVITTVDAFGKDNGKLVLATSDVVNQVLRHVKNVKSDPDLRAKIRAIESRLLSEHAGFLIGNQALDFHKQDGVTEIEESIEANLLERKFNDQLLADEVAGKVRIQRDVALIGCVSNFSNFLDLCRKTLRNLELGVPVLVLSRSNTTQHMYRWVQLLLSEMKSEGLDLGLVTYASCSIAEQRRMMSELSHCPFYLTGSREVASKIKELMPFTFASTGGPNTMVVPSLDESSDAAARMSCAIENSGQCTAMRHLVTDRCSEEDLKRIFRDVEAVDASVDSLRKGAFDGLFRGWAKDFRAAPGYNVLNNDSKAAAGSQPVAFRIGEAGELPPGGIEEHWRRLYLDVSTPPHGTSVSDASFLSRLSKWLKKEQPITLAVNGDNEDAGFPMMQQLFSSTAQAVYSVGRKGKPCLTAQARPQDGEIFGEFPPRLDMFKYSAGPVFVPSSTPSYMARYETGHLRAAASRLSSTFGGSVLELLQSIKDEETRGYAVLLAEYLKESCGPKRGCGQRTSLFGLQRPPIQEVSVLIRIRQSDDPGATALKLLPFLLTNAKEGLVISQESSSNSIQELGLQCFTESEDSFRQRSKDSNPWNIVEVGEERTMADELPMVDHFVLRLFPMGHIKSSSSDDEEFVKAFESSQKWLRYQS